MATSAARHAGARLIPPAPLVALVGGAWLIMLAGDISGTAPLLHHHALISSGGPPLWLGALMFLAAWLVMIVGMMVPASMPAIRRAGRGRLVGFLSAYAAVWLTFGFVAFIGDIGLHSVVHATPWLLERPWLISVAVLVVAGLYQLASVKHRALDACRHPLGEDRRERGFEAGRRHAVDCLVSSWALMLVMFAAGFASLAWMVALTVVMAYEAVGMHGHRVATAFGLVLIGLAGLSAAVALTVPGASNGLF